MAGGWGEIPCYEGFPDFEISPLTGTDQQLKKNTSERGEEPSNPIRAGRTLSFYRPASKESIWPFLSVNFYHLLYFSSQIIKSSGYKPVCYILWNQAVRWERSTCTCTLVGAVHAGIVTAMLNRCRSFLTPESFDHFPGQLKKFRIPLEGLA